jgi:predicted lipid-binding transport protein (Tim44 family)
MANGYQIIDILIFAAIAAFFIIRLRSVLGKRTGHSKRQDFDIFDKDKQADKKAKDADAGEEEDKVISLPDRRRSSAEGAEDVPDAGSERQEDIEEDVESWEERGFKKAGIDSPSPALSAGLREIRSLDKNFDIKGFVEGARAAFDIIVAAYAQGDTRALRPLLSNDVYGDFSSAIEARKKAGETLETTLVGIDHAEILEAQVQSRTAFVTVKFISQQINVVRDSQGKVVDGDPDQMAQVTDIWTFARNTRSRDPNWTLVATRSEN